MPQPIPITDHGISFVPPLGRGEETLHVSSNVLGAFGNHAPALTKLGINKISIAGGEGSRRLSQEFYVSTGSKTGLAAQAGVVLEAIADEVPGSYVIVSRNIARGGYASLIVPIAA